MALSAPSSAVVATSAELIPGRIEITRPIRCCDATTEPVNGAAPGHQNLRLNARYAESPFLKAG